MTCIHKSQVPEIVRDITAGVIPVGAAPGLARGASAGIQ